MAPSPESSTPASEVILERGRAIDRFVVLGLVGRGGMGEVYAAYDPELDRKVAIKLLRARGDSEEGKARLLREAQATAKLQHPNVVVVYDVGTFGDSVFLAMEFVEGRTVNGWLHAAPRSRREILDVYLAAGRGLAAAHAAGLVHRDFKPDNVMVTNDGQVRVMDFGLARQLGEPDAAARRSNASLLASPATTAGERATFSEALSESYDPDATREVGRGGGPEVVSPSGKYLSIKLTQTGAMLGTPAYMAPEQFAVRATDERTDQFSFCVALYEALYGKRPFGGETFVALMTSVTTGAVSVPPPRTKVPAWIRKVLLRGLQTAPERRFSSVNSLLAALQKDPTVRARRMAIGAGALLCVVALAFGQRRMVGAQHAMCRNGADKVAGLWDIPGAPSPRKDAIHRAFLATGQSYSETAFIGVTRLLDLYVVRWVEMYQDACEATQVHGEQSAEVLDLRMGCLQERLAGVRATTELFGHADRAVVENAVSAAGGLPRLERCADVPLLRAVVKPPDDEAARREVARLRGDVAKLAALRDGGHCADAEKMAGSLLEEGKKVGYLPLLADALNAAGRLMDQCGDAKIGFQRYKEAYATGLASSHDEAAAEAAVILSTELSDRLMQPMAARDWYVIARAMLARIGSRPVLEAWLHIADGTILQKEGRGREAVEAYGRALEIEQRVLPKGHYDILVVTNNMGNALQLAGRSDEALVKLARAREDSERVLGPGHPLVAMVSNNEGEVLNLLGRYAEGRVAYQRSLDVWRRSNVDEFLLAFALTGLGRAYIGEGRPAEGIGPLEEALRIRTAKAVESESLGFTRFSLAAALWSQPAHRDRARALARQARSELAQVTKPTMPLPDVDAWLRAPSARL
jgi:eukaryotic-like serine/threonine-protein kinase